MLDEIDKISKNEKVSIIKKFEKAKLSIDEKLKN